MRKVIILLVLGLLLFTSFSVAKSGKNPMELIWSEISLIWDTTNDLQQQVNPLVQAIDYLQQQIDEIPEPITPELTTTYTMEWLDNGETVCCPEGSVRTACDGNPIHGVTYPIEGNCCYLMQPDTETPKKVWITCLSYVE